MDLNSFSKKYYLTHFIVSLFKMIPAFPHLPLGCLPRLKEYVTNFSLALEGLIGGNRRVAVVYHCRLNLSPVVGQVAEFKFELKFKVKFYAILASISTIIDS